MLPTWVGEVMAVSLAILALAGVTLAATQVAAARRMERFLRLFERLAGPAVSDVRDIVATIRTEVDGLAGASRDLRARLVKAADTAEVRLGELDALLDVVQEEVEGAALDVAATLRIFRRGLTVIDWGRRALRRGRKGERGERR